MCLIFDANTKIQMQTWDRHFSPMHWDTPATALQSTYEIMLLTTIYNTALTAAGVTTIRAAALQLAYTLSHRRTDRSHSSTLSKRHPVTAPPTDRHSLSERATLSSNESQRRQNTGKRTVGMTGHSTETHNTEA